MLSGSGPASKLVAPLICFSFGYQDDHALYRMRHGVYVPLQLTPDLSSVGRYFLTPDRWGTGTHNGQFRPGLL